MLIIIEAPHFVAGVVVGERPAPIISYMTKWTQPRIIKYCMKKKWKCRLLFDEKTKGENYDKT